MSNEYTTTQTNQFSNEVPPNNNLVWAIICTVSCCLPLGIYAIIKSNEVNKKWAMGDKAGAIASANAAKKFSMIGMAIGAVIIIAYIIFAVFLVSSGAMTEIENYRGY